MGKHLNATTISTYIHLIDENCINTSFKRARPETEEENTRLIVKPAPNGQNVCCNVLFMRLIFPTKLARYTLQANMSYWVLEASMINFKITSTIKAIKSQILCKKQLAGATNASMYSYETHFPQS